jgi:hypothetical protein
LKSSFSKAIVVALLLARWATAQCDDLECVPAQGGPPSATSGYELRCIPQTQFNKTCWPPLPLSSYWTPRCDWDGPLEYTGQVEPPCVQWWARTDYLLWTLTDAPINSPLVTTSTAGLPTLTNPTTSVLYGNNPADLRAFSGGRLTLGRWLTDDHLWGVEANAFVLAHQGTSFTASSDAAGSPTLGVPFNVAGAQLVQPVSVPGISAGLVSVASSARLWGSQVDLLRNLYRSQSGYINFTTGFRYLDLQEHLQLNTDQRIIAPVGTVTSSDSFGTRNQFYGVNLALQSGWQWKRFSVDAVKSVALGTTHQSVDISGSTTTGLGTVPAGLFTLSSGAGNHVRNQFNAIPQLQVRGGYALTNYLRATVGYDALFFGNVVRPGNQINSNVAMIPNAPAFKGSGLWAQGVSFGIEYRY